MSWGRGCCLSHCRQVLFLQSRKRHSVSSITVPRILSTQSPNTLPSVPVALFTTSTSQPSGSDQHALFLQQLQELEKERKECFGDDIGQEKDSDNELLLPGVTTTTARNATVPEEPSLDSNSVPLAGEFELDMEELHAEREALFQFTVDEKEAWKSHSSTNHGNPFQARLSPQLLQDIEAARAAASAAVAASSSTETGVDSTSSPSSTLHHHESFSHVSNDSQSIHMVDVGQKQVTTRTARAQSIIRLPPEVVQALDIQQSSSSSELVGPKGPIFATAKLAGIMAAKKTSDLIPLCHPLPLDQVQVDIRMSSDHQEIIVECTCRVTHKTGVEMEALTGASVAALTIYDMVKAVSHRVEISSTKLLSKTGGKRNLGTTEE